MRKQTTKGMNRTIDRAAMDALFQGISRSLDYLGEQKWVILDRMGDLMLEYLVETGKVKSPEKPKQFAQSLKKFLKKNGFEARMLIEYKGGPPVVSIRSFINYLEPKNRLGRNASSRLSKKRGRVDWVLFEMALYGMTKALDDQLGAQAQLMLDRVGTEIVNYLADGGLIEPSDDPNTLFLHVKDFFIKAGYARNLEFKWEGSPPHSFESTYQAARYFTVVFSRLRNEGSALLSCPLCLAGHSIMARSQGLKFKDAVEYKILPGNKVFMRSKIYPPTQTFTEEDARKISQMTS